MRSEYGRWSKCTSIHAVGYDEKWLCGKTGNTASVCSNDLDDVNCKACLKKLADYQKEHYLDWGDLRGLKRALETLNNLIKNLKGEKSRCACDNDTERILYINTWIIPEIRNIIDKFEGDEE